MDALPDPVYLAPTYFINFNADNVSHFVHSVCGDETDPVRQATDLYYAIRDGIRYDPYSMEDRKSAMQASTILSCGHGYCVAKAVLLAACARHRKIPARLGFADVRNHLNSKRLRSLMETDLFIYHGFTELFLNGKWVKATPAFDIKLCQKAGVKPLEFDGSQDSVFHEYNVAGDRHMEYVNDHGHFADLPFDRIMAESRRTYPKYFENLEKFGKDFRTEAIRIL